MALFSYHVSSQTSPCLVRVTLAAVDRNAILAINRQSDHRRDEALLCGDLANPKTIGSSAVRGPVVVGFALYKYDERSIDLEWVAVAKKFRGDGIGRKLISDLARKCDESRRPILKAIVHEENAAAHRFLARCGFFALRTVRDHFNPANGHPETRDGYLFTLDIASRARKALDAAAGGVPDASLARQNAPHTAP